MKCTYRKLKESITDNAFPILPVVEEKSYFYQNAALQEVVIDDIVDNVPYNTVKIEAVVKATSNTFSKSNNFLTTRSGYAVLGVNVNKLKGRMSSSLDFTVTNNPSVGVDTTLIIDAPNKTITLGEEYLTNSEASITTGNIRECYLFKDTDIDLFRIKSIKITSNGTLVADLVPALIAGVGCVYNKVTNKAYYPNTGSLGIEE